MAFEFGFYNSIDGDRTYDADQFGDLFTGLITDGVYASIGDALMTTPGPGLSVLVGTGRAWFNKTWNVNRTKMQLNLDLADLLLPRIDAVVLEVNKNSFSRTNSIKIITGTPSANPTRPGYSATNNVYQYPLAYIYVKANAEAIEAKDITVVVGQAPTNFVSAMLDTVDITTMYQHWEQQFSDWFADVQSQLSDDVAGNLLHKIEVLESDNATIKSDLIVVQNNMDAISDVLLAPIASYDHIIFASTGVWSVPSNLDTRYPCIAICIGGGGGGGLTGIYLQYNAARPGYGYGGGGGGGSGRVDIRSFHPSPGQQINVVIGGGGRGGIKSATWSKGSGSQYAWKITDNVNGSVGGSTYISQAGCSAIGGSGGGNSGDVIHNSTDADGGYDNSNTLGGGGSGEAGGSGGSFLRSNGGSVSGTSITYGYGPSGSGVVSNGNATLRETVTISGSVSYSGYVKGGDGIYSKGGYLFMPIITTGVAGFGASACVVPFLTRSGLIRLTGGGGGSGATKTGTSNASFSVSGNAGGSGVAAILYKIKS